MFEEISELLWTCCVLLYCLCEEEYLFQLSYASSPLRDADMTDNLPLQLTGTILEELNLSLLNIHLPVQWPASPSSPCSPVWVQLTNQQFIYQASAHGSNPGSVLVPNLNLH